jgi:hypothetical protein
MVAASAAVAVGAVSSQALQLQPHHSGDTLSVSKQWLNECVGLLLLLQALPQGKLYSYNPTTKETHLIAKGFYYSNGVAVSEDDDFLVISETDRLRLVKYWLKGPKVGGASKACLFSPHIEQGW